MRRQNTEGFRSRYVRWFRAIGLTLGGVLLMAASGHAGALTASWTAPTTNTDGSALTNLALYRVYYSESDSPCPSSTFFEVASSTSTPPPDQTVSFQLTGLTTGSIYSVSVTAVDTDGNESACSDAASAIALDDAAVTPTDTVTPAPSARIRTPGAGVGTGADNGEVVNCQGAANPKMDRRRAARHRAPRAEMSSRDGVNSQTPRPELPGIAEE